MRRWDRFRRRLCADIIARDTLMARARADAFEHKFNVVRNELTHLRDLLMAKANAARELESHSSGKPSFAPPKLPNDGGNDSGGSNATA